MSTGRWVAGRAAVIATLISVALGTRASVGAQTGATGATAPPRIGCFRGRPLPTCKSFWIVEMTGDTPLAQTTREISYQGNPPFPVRSFEEQLEWNLGHMVNVTPRFALGGVLTLGTGGDGGGDILSGLKLRGRRWLNADLSVELEGGVRRRGGYPSPAYGVTADARLNIRDQGAFYVRWDGLQLPRYEDPPGLYLDPGGFQQALSVGAGLGSIPALVGTGALGLAFLVLLAAWADEFS